MHRFKQVFHKTKCVVIGMVHVQPLPGTPRYKGSIQQIIDKACQEAETYAQCNIDAVMIENMHDIPYVNSEQFTPETTAIMTKVCAEVKNVIPNNMPCGVQVLACGNKESLAISLACNLDFIRAEGFVFGHLGDEGPAWACAGPLLRYRAVIGAQNVMVWTDIKKKHSSHAITDDLSLVDIAKAAEFFLSDGLILTGTETGVPADPDELSDLKSRCKSPIIVGSGVTDSNLQEYLAADAVIVGSHFKKAGYWENDLDKNRVNKFMKRACELRLGLESSGEITHHS